jgi:hypothetical protein
MVFSETVGGVIQRSTSFMSGLEPLWYTHMTIVQCLLLLELLLLL